MECRTAALARRFSREERQDVNREWTKPPTAAKVRRQAASALPRGALAAVADTKPVVTGGEKAALTIVLVPLGQRVAILTLTTHSGFDPYPQARNLMRRMLGLKPLASRRRRRAAAAGRAGRGRPLRAPLSARSTLLVLRGLLGGLERVQHALLHVRGSLGERHDRLAAVGLDAALAVMARLGSEVSASVR